MDYKKELRNAIQITNVSEISNEIVLILKENLIQAINHLNVDEIITEIFKLKENVAQNIHDHDNEEFLEKLEEILDISVDKEVFISDYTKYVFFLDLYTSKLPVLFNQFREHVKYALENQESKFITRLLYKLESFKSGLEKIQDSPKISASKEWINLLNNEQTKKRAIKRTSNYLKN